MVEHGMKQSDLRPCHVCGKGLMHAGAPFFYRVAVEQMVVNIGAVRRQHGLETMLGEAAPLAEVLGPNEDMATAVQARSGVLLCSDCALDFRLPIHCLMEEKSDDAINGD